MAKLISVITPSLNHGRFLRDTIASIRDQDYDAVEHIVVDGGSTDNTQEILESCPWIRWVSQPERNIIDAYRTAIDMCSGDYVIQCCISDGFLDRDWFSTCASVLDARPDVSMVWGLPRYMSEDGELGRISYAEFLEREAPQREAFLPFWLASAFVLPEGNYCLRRTVLDACFPVYSEDVLDGINPHLPFNYTFHAEGYLAQFVPVIANYGRTHGDQRGQKNRTLEAQALARYRASVARLRRDVLTGKRRHVFRDGQSNELGTLTSRELPAYRRQTLRYQWDQLKERARASYRYRVGRFLKPSPA